MMMMMMMMMVVVVVVVVEMIILRVATYHLGFILTQISFSCLLALGLVRSHCSHKGSCNRVVSYTLC
jgi:hypothetical protein